MTNKINFTYKILLVTGVVIFLYLILIIPKIEPIWTNFWDANDYRLQSESAVFSKDFLAPVPRRWYTPRPFTTSLMYKLADSDSFKMVMLQKFFYCFSIFAFIFSFFQYLKSKKIKIISFFSLLFFFTWWRIVGWSNNVVSESISLSFMFLWLAAILCYYKFQNILSIAVLLVISVLLSFSRDTWPYIILVFFLINILIFIKRKKLKTTIPMFLFSLVLLLVQGYTVKEGERAVMPVFNSIAGRIAQNDDYLDWFTKKGMPQGAQLVNDFRNVNIDSESGKLVIYKHYYDSTYTELFDWIKVNGKTEYQKFLLLHPYYFFLADQNSKQLKRIWADNLKFYYQSPKGFFANAVNVFPFFNIWCTLPLVTICAYLWRKRKKIIYIFPVVIFVLFTVNVFLSYNADTMEVERHLFITQIIQQFINMLMIVILSDFLFRFYKIRKRTPKGLLRSAQ